MAQMKCPECGCDISVEISRCPFCDCLINANNEKELKIGNSIEKHNINNDKVQKYRVISVLLFVCACVLFIIAITRVNNSNYTFYKEHYNDCMSGYDDSKYGERTSGLLFKGTYNMIADEYKEMADEDMSKIWKYRGQAIGLALCGIVCITVGCILNKKAKAWSI